VLCWHQSPRTHPKQSAFRLPLARPFCLPQITSLEWSSSKLRGPMGITSVLATGGLDGKVRLWAAPLKLV